MLPHSHTHSHIHTATAAFTDHYRLFAGFLCRFMEARLNGFNSWPLFFFLHAFVFFSVPLLKSFLLSLVVTPCSFSAVFLSFHFPHFFFFSGLINVSSTHLFCPLLLSDTLYQPASSSSPPHFILLFIVLLFLPVLCCLQDKLVMVATGEGQKLELTLHSGISLCVSE